MMPNREKVEGLRLPRCHYQRQCDVHCIPLRGPSGGHSKCDTQAACQGSVPGSTAADVCHRDTMLPNCEQGEGPPHC